MVDDVKYVLYGSVAFCDIPRLRKGNVLWKINKGCPVWVRKVVKRIELERKLDDFEGDSVAEV